MSTGEPLLILGSGRLFERVRMQWPQREPRREIRTVELAMEDMATLQETVLHSHPAGATRVFAAFDSTALNFARLDLLSRLRLLGYRADTFVHPSAFVDATATIAENCYIAEGAVVGPRARIAYNCFLGAGARLGHQVQVQHSCWIEAGVTCGDGCGVGMHSILGLGVIVGHGVKIGNYCGLEVPAHHDTDVSDRTYFHPQFDRPVRIYTA